MESVDNVHVFLLTFYLCSLFQQWMHQDFASQSKCNALVTSSTFRCAFKELFFKIYFTKLFSSAFSAFFPLIVSNTYSFLIHVGMMMIYTGSSNVISRP